MLGFLAYSLLALRSQDLHAEDDATMATDDVMEVNERLARLEKTVAEGFEGHVSRFVGLENRMGRLEDRMAALDSKLDIFSETIRGDLKTVLEAVTAGTEEMRRTTEAIRKEHAADRGLTRSILNDHAVRIRELERKNPEPLEPR